MFSVSVTLYLVWWHFKLGWVWTSYSRSDAHCYT